MLFTVGRAVHTNLIVWPSRRIQLENVLKNREANIYPKKVVIIM